MLFAFNLLKFICILNGLVSFDAFGTFSDDFKNYIIKNHNQSYLELFEQKQLGLGYLGSFGGKFSDQETSNKTPIILFHGGSHIPFFFDTAKKYLIKRGYKFGDVYGITIDDGVLNLLTFMAADCEYVKLVRQFIKLVSEYRKDTPNLNLVTYSTASPFVRKAILGGKCIDSGEELGPSLTTKINTFVSIAGPNYGFESCNYLKAVTRHCNMVNGMICKSKFLVDINNQTSKFEGKKTYSIYSQLDWIVGQQCCGNICSELKNADKNYILNHLEHFSLAINSFDLIYHLFNYE
uniref:Lipase_GDSL domain-containing protein n=1 Tax=Rhabditophanes sp. KR3021 TaxID=114890 RepID=A0AC35THG3_9BILA